jgi:Thioesterase-like superfamily
MRSDAVFELDGDRLVPSELARGPWSPDAQHGGPPAALLARAIERADPGPAPFVARLTVEFLRPVPLAPLTVQTRTVRPGRRVQWLEASLVADDVEVARASAVRLRVDPGLALPVPDPEASTVPRPASGSPYVIQFPNTSVGFWQAMELRVAAGSFAEVGEATIWFRLVVPVVADEEPTPLQRVAAAADFGNGVSAALERGRYLFINPDLTIHLHRGPVGEWVALEARTHAEANGVGLAESALHDERGRIGRSLQSLLLDRL